MLSPGTPPVIDGSPETDRARDVASLSGVLTTPNFRRGSATSIISVGTQSLRASWSRLNVEGGIVDLSWGTAGGGPLDVFSTASRSDAISVDSMSKKKQTPVLHASYELGPSAKLEFVYSPIFVGNSWGRGSAQAPAQLKTTRAVADSLGAQNGSVALRYPDSSGLEYAQYGFRLTGAIGQNECGAQVFFGNYPDPAVSSVSVLGGKYLQMSLAYNRYAQLGLEWSRTVGAIHLHDEVAANITSDLSGKDGSSYNPRALWLAGAATSARRFDLSAQASGLVRLLYGGVGSDPFDAEAGLGPTSTAFLVSVTRGFSFASGNQSVGATARWGIEDGDCCVMPRWSLELGDATLSAEAGIFAGNPLGSLGQYRDDDYVRLSFNRAW